MTPLESIQDFIYRLHAAQDLDALDHYCTERTRFIGRIAFPGAYHRLENDLETVRSALGIDIDSMIFLSPYEFRCEEIAADTVAVHASYGIRRRGWSSAAPPVRVQRNAIVHIHEGKITALRHRIPARALWHELLQIDHEERQRGWRGPSTAQERQRTEDISRVLAFHRWSLPPRLRQVAQLVIEGHTDKEIAALLNLATNSVSDYVKEVRRRAGVKRRHELARAAGVYSLLLPH